MDAWQGGGEEAAAAHAGIDGEVDGERRVGGRGVELVEVFGLLEGRDAGDPAVVDDFGALAGGGRAEQVDALVGTGAGEAACFGGVGDAEELDAG